MGKASRLRRERGPRRSREDLLTLLVENQQFLERSAVAFDEGYAAEAKRLAVVLRVLLHDTNQSHSLLERLGVKERLPFLDTADPINPNNLLPTPGLLMMTMSTAAGTAKGDYVAPLGDLPPGRPVWKPFASWWQNPVMKVDGTWSRKELVLTLANQEGGAHVDPELNERYEALARHNALGWVAFDGAKEEPFEGSPIAVAVRQITYEVIETLGAARAVLADGEPGANNEMGASQTS
jgi:hypothetical protein